MAHGNPARVQRQVAAHHQRLLPAPGLPFSNVLDQPMIQQALDAEPVCFRHRLFSPLVTVWTFLSQCLDPDHSCRQAVCRVLAWRTSQNLPRCSTNTGSYCAARARLPEGVLARLTRDTARRLHAAAPEGWRWLGRTVKIVDGTTVSMPDTPDNQAAFPHPRTQKAGVGFPIARMVVLFCLATGTVLDALLGRYLGKRTSELALFHPLHDNLGPKDVLVADRYFCSYWEVAAARQRGADVVFRQHQRRQTDFRRGRRLGRCDHVVTWQRPARPDWMEEAEYQGLPATLAVREVRVRVRQRGFRTRVLVVVTTLRDAREIAAAELAVLYRVRWQAELDLRSLKQTLQMDILRCKTPEMVRKEVWAHLLAYNLIRGVMAEAATEAELLPVQLSFTGALQSVRAFAPLVWTATGEQLERIRRRLRQALREHEVGDRPDRWEPRARKRRPKHYPFLNESRQQARSRMESRRCG
jgi:hypothetical protein